MAHFTWCDTKVEVSQTIVNEYWNTPGLNEAYSAYNPTNASDFTRYVADMCTTLQRNIDVRKRYKEELDLKEKHHKEIIQKTDENASEQRELQERLHRQLKGPECKRNSKPRQRTMKKA